MAIRQAGKSAIAKMVETLTDMKHGNVSGRTLGMFHDFGWLPDEWRASFRLADYAVYSYETPIAWHTDGMWTVPAVTYSPTTTQHQHAVRFALAQNGREFQTAP